MRALLYIHFELTSSLNKSVLIKIQQSQAILMTECVLTA
jgi:hypothetical protein